MSIIKNILKTKIKSHSGEVTDFYNKEFRKVDSNHNCLAVIKSANTLKKKLTRHTNNGFEGAILKMHFLRGQLWKYFVYIYTYKLKRKNENETL